MRCRLNPTFAWLFLVRLARGHVFGRLHATGWDDTARHDTTRLDMAWPCLAWPGRAPQKCSAPQYVDHVMTWVEDQINKEDIFPTTPGEQPNRKRGGVLSCPVAPTPPPPSRDKQTMTSFRKVDDVDSCRAASPVRCGMHWVSVKGGLACSSHMYIYVKRADR